jgi:hypothetical protein
MAYYNKLRDQFRNETPLPEELSWEAMQAGIYDKMGQKKKKRRLIFWWLLPVLISGGLGTFWYFVNDKNAFPVANQTNINIITSTGKTQALQNKKVNVTNQSSEKQTDTDSNIALKKANININQSNAKTFNIKSQNILNIVTKPTKSFVNSSNKNNQNSKTKNENENIAKSKHLDIVTIDNLANQGYSNQVNPYAPKTYFMIEPLALPSFDSVISMQTGSLPTSKRPLIFPLNNSKNKYLGAMDMMASAGISWWSLGTPITLVLNTENHKATITEKELPSFNFAIRNDISINKYFFVSSLIDYQQLYSVFSYDGVKTKTTAVDDVVISITENLITGEQSIVRGSANSKVTTARKLQSKNEQIRSTFSLLPGIQFATAKWTFKVNIGPTISLFSKGEGKTLWNEEIETYNGDLPHYNNKIKIGVTSSVLVKYQFAQQWYIHANVLQQKQYTNHSADQTKIIKPNIWSLNAGVGYSF